MIDFLKCGAFGDTLYAIAWGILSGKAAEIVVNLLYGFPATLAAAVLASFFVTLLLTRRFSRQRIAAAKAEVAVYREMLVQISDTQTYTTE